MLKNANQEYISSNQLAERLHLNPPQIRKDLSYFGEFGVRGVGYPVNSTADRIRNILKLDVAQKAVLIGAGRLGTAIAAYPGFEMFGFDIAAIFDNDSSKIGTKVGKNTVEDIAKISKIREQDIQLAILAVPAQSAQSVVDMLVGCHIKGILNLSPCYVIVPTQTKVITIDIAMELGILPYYM